MPVASLRLAFPRALTLALAVALAVLPSMARADDTQRAKEFFQQGTTYFNLGDFDKAIEAFQEAYKAKPDPLFLYNIGQAYRLKGDAGKAIFFYKGYLRNAPKAPNR
ncbi:MAG TPA: tetratricopeptide repeat protein, partial [Polyangia bacterium]|nr:tetratricopeptide repeat protein [Polyangia bacterium]